MLKALLVAEPYLRLRARFAEVDWKRTRRLRRSLARITTTILNRDARQDYPRSVQTLGSSGKPVYLDYAATTPVDPQVIARMEMYLGPDGTFGNPASTLHSFGQQAHQAVECAQAQVADLLNADPSEIVWTSGATESINLAIKGVVRGRVPRGGHIVVSSMEHKAVLDTSRQLEHEGFEVSQIEPDPDGLISADHVAGAVRDDTVLVSLMHVNNEVGTISDIQNISEVTAKRGIIFHVDAAQAAARLELDMRRTEVDLVSLSAHKIYGPKGVGALYVRHRPERIRLQPQIHGGGQQHGLRAGTLATHQLVGMGEAARIAKERHVRDAASAQALERHLLEQLAEIGDVYVNGNQRERVPGIVSVTFPAVKSQSLLLLLGGRIAISSGSACTTSTIEPSHVLQALRLHPDDANCSVRLSVGRFTTPEQIDIAVHHITRAVSELRRLASSTRPPTSAGLEPPQHSPIHSPLSSVLAEMSRRPC